MAPTHQPRRAAAARQRAQGRHVARGAATVPALRDRALPAVSVRAVPRPRRHHGPVAGRGPRSRQLWEGPRHGRLLRTRLVARSRSEAALRDALPGAALARYDVTAVAQPDGRMSASELPTAAPVRTAVIGLGYWGPNLARGLQEQLSAELVAVRDLREDALARVDRRYPYVRTTRSLEAILAADDIEAVAIATPVSTHHPIARAALQAGKHVFVEKPLAASAEQALDLAVLAEESGLIL